VSEVQLTVLTDPVADVRRALPIAARAAARRVRNALRPPPPYFSKKYRGHFAVTRSLVEGLEKIGARANYNPRFVGRIAPTVIVLSGLNTLAQAIELRRKGRIRRLIAGPNILDFPSDYPDLIAAPEVDLCITPALPTAEMYARDLPQLAGRIAPWAAGVDTEYWSPGHLPAANNVLVFVKENSGPIPPIQPYVQYMERKGYCIAMLRYGSYLPGEYRNLLRQSAVMVGFVAVESQGIAWAEAWAANIPTLLWNQPTSTFDHPRYKGVAFPTTTAPYLSRDTGLFFRSYDEFARVFEQWETERTMFRPREWVLKNMSDEVCARRLCKLAEVDV